MYGTLSFDKGDKRSSSEFHAFSAVQGRRQRQPACDGCRIARVKCRRKSEGDKCGRCRSTNRACTYNSTRRQSRSTVGEPTEPPRTANSTEADSEEDEREGCSSATDSESARVDTQSASSPRASTPLLQHTQPELWNRSLSDCHLETFDFFVDPVADIVMDGSQDVAARQQVDGASTSGSILHDHDGATQPFLSDLGSVMTAGEQDVPHHYSFAALYNDFPLQMSLSTPSLSPAPSLVWSILSKHDEHHQGPPSLSSETQVDDSGTLQHKEETKDHTTPTMTSYSDLIEAMQSAKGGSGSTTPTSSSCKCLQDLTAILFGLRSRADTMQVDRFLVLFRQAMSKWEAMETCPSACYISQGFALLVLMNVQELVALLLEVTSSVNAAKCASGRQDSVPAINVGEFNLEDVVDQGIVAHILLAARMKGLHSFITRISSQMKLAGLEEIGTKFHYQLETLRRAFTS